LRRSAAKPLRTVTTGVRLNEMVPLVALYELGIAMARMSAPSPVETLSQPRR
jgi:hypothetical protein